MKKRENVFVKIIQEPAKSRIENKQCPSCGKPQNEWRRRTDWTCCSPDCTSKFENFCIIRSWVDLRLRCFKRDNFTCKKCGIDIGQFIADHIVPIALGGEQWDINNLQTLCSKCNKIKTRNDAKNIAHQRRIEKILDNGKQKLL